MILRNRTTLSAVLLFSLGTLSIAANHAGAGGVSEQIKARAIASYGKLPLSFEENRGQADARVKFLSNGSASSILLSPSEVLLNLHATGTSQNQSTIRVGFPGANPAPDITGGERQGAVSSYFIGKDPAKWVAGAPNFGRVHYRGLYPGIDLAFYGNQGQLEYDFVVSPGADPKAIRLALDGVDGVRIDTAGDLIMSTTAGEVRQHKPIVYQGSGTLRKTIDGRYILQSHNRVAFAVGKYDTRKPLIIDPVLTFATYLGSPGDELAIGISAAASQATFPAVAVDSQGNIYLTGFNGGNPFAGHTVSPLAGGGVGVFVVKMNPTGSLLYTVFFGGGLITDVGGGIAADSAGNAYITGYTTSSNFPITAGAPQTTFNGNGSQPNAFVAKVNAGGTALVYSTYLGGSGSFWGRAIAVDHFGNAYVTGAAAASGGTSFPLVNPLSSTPSAGFLTEINAGGTSFVYSTYMPAPLGIGYGIAVDGNSDAYVTGSSGTPSSPSPAQTYVLKVNAGGSSLGYEAFPIGNTGAQTVGFGIALDAENDAYITGMTNDQHFPLLLSAAQPSYGGGSYDGFALKLSASGGLVYGTYLGGIGSNLIPERGSGIGVDSVGNAYISGTTECIGFPTVNQISGARNGGQEVLMKGTVSGSSSNWSSAGLTGNFDEVTALAFDPNGNIYAGASSLNAAGGGIYKSTSGGNSWTFENTGITSSTIDSIAVDPNASATVYAAGSGHLYQTTNGGASWTQLAQAVGTSAVIAIAKTSPSTIYVGSSSGLIYSTTGGSAWNNPATPPAGTVNAIVVDPNTALTAYAGTTAGVYKTVDGGQHWSAPFGSFGDVTSLAINGLTSTIYAATSNGVFYTTNAGSTWLQLTLGQVASTPMLVAVDSGNNVYVAFQGAGMATGTNGGTQSSDWSQLTYSGLTHNQVVALAAPPNSSGVAYAGIVSATTAFLTELSPNGQILSSTCIGGSDNNLGQSIAVTPGGAAYVAGATIATNFPATQGAVQTSNAGLYDAFIAGVDVPPAQIDSPLPGTTLSGSLADFAWNSVAGATNYQLTVGTTPGGTNIFSGTVAQTSQVVSAIPCASTGSTIYVQLTANVGGNSQQAADYSYVCKSAIGDFNGDGHQDLLWQNNTSGQVNVNYYNGAQGITPDGSACVSCGINTTQWQLVGSGDFDGNGVPDLVYQNRVTHQVNVDYYANSGGNATFIGFACLSCGINTTNWQVVAVADFDGNGVPDLVYQNTQSHVVHVDYYGGPRGATLTGFACLSCGINTTNWQVKAAADFDGNGVPDLVYQNTQTHQVHVDYYGGTGGAILIGFACLSCSINTTNWMVVGASDFDGNGVPDLVYQNTQTGQVNVDYYGGSGGSVLEGFSILSAANPGWTPVVPRSR